MLTCKHPAERSLHCCLAGSPVHSYAWRATPAALCMCWHVQPFAVACVARPGGLGAGSHLSDYTVIAVPSSSLWVQQCRCVYVHVVSKGCQSVL